MKIETLKYGLSCVFCMELFVFGCSLNFDESTGLVDGTLLPTILAASCRFAMTQ